MIEMEPNKIYTIRCRRQLTREEWKVRKTRIISLVAGILIGTVLALLCVSGADSAEPERAPQQVTGKLETPVIATVALLSPVETAQPEQVTEPRYDVPLTDEELATLLEACEENHIAPEITLGLIQVESSFNPGALNPRSGCYGYLQLNPRYFQADLSPVDNIRTGIAYLAHQLERYDGDMAAALTAYNAGHDTGSRTYAAKVLAAAESFKAGKVSE